MFTSPASKRSFPSPWSTCLLAVGLAWTGTQPALAQTGVRAKDPAAAVGSNVHWVATWGVSPLTQEAFPGTTSAPTPPTFTDVTLRQIVHTSIGGSQARVRLSNALGTTSLVVNAATVGLRSQGAQLTAGSIKALTFGGRSTVTIPPGGLAVSDPVDIQIPALGDVAISTYFQNATAGTTLHSESKQTNYVFKSDQTRLAVPEGGTTQLPYYFLTNLEVAANPGVTSIVCLGDSITDGTNSTPDTNHRWPNFFAQRLLSGSGTAPAHGVVDEGISGNRIYNNVAGPNIFARFDRDVVAQVAASDVILLIGINDIGFSGFVPTQAVNANDIISGYRQIIARAHDAGLKIYGATLTPFAGVGAPYYSDAGEAAREQVNNFIRTGGEFDGVIDFEAAVRDTQNPPHLLPQYDSGDHLHPSDAGYQAMANAIPLQFFGANN